MPASFVLVACRLGFFTSARIAEQVRAGIQALPRGPALRRPGHGLHAAADLPLRAAADGFRIIIPPLTSESMNIFKNSSVAFAVVLAELTMFAHAGAGGDLARHRGLPRGDGAVLRLGVRGQPHHGASSRSAPACRASSAGGERRPTCDDLDFAFLNWDVITDFMSKGF